MKISRKLIFSLAVIGGVIYALLPVRNIIDRQLTHVSKRDHVALAEEASTKERKNDQIRGFAVVPNAGGIKLTVDDFRRIKALGADGIRLDLSAMKLMEQEAGPDGVFDFNERNIAYMHQLIGYAKSVGLKVVIDPHAMPGAKKVTTLWRDDPFWFDKKYYDAVVRLWDRIIDEVITTEYDDVIWGYDLINEPHPRPQNPVFELNDLYKELVLLIRSKENTQGARSRRIILAFSNWGDYRSYVKPPSWYADDTSSLYFTTHFYWPFGFTMQGNGKHPKGALYPSPSKGWDENGLRKNLSSTRAWANKHGNWRMYIGEFGLVRGPDLAWNCNCSNPSNGGDVWFRDALKIFSEYGWSYTIHSYSRNQGKFNVHASPKQEKVISEMLKND